MYASRMERLGDEMAFPILSRARELENEGRDIIHLDVGEPDFDTPKFIRDAAVEALRSGHIAGSPSAGLPEVRAGIAEYVSRTRGLDFEADNVVVTPGAKSVIFFSLLACVNEGDEVIYPDPSLPTYKSIIHFLGAKPVPLTLREENGFGVDVGELAALISDRTRFLILNSPTNPTGGTIARDDLEVIAALVRDRNVMVLSDEVYSRILYDGEHHSISTLPGMKDKTILLDGHSKTYAMAGWRLGYGVMNPQLCALVARLMTNSHSCTSLFVQRAGLAALEGPQDEVVNMVEQFRRRRDLLVDGLNSIAGISCLRPKGAFYAFANVTGLAISSCELVRGLLEDAGVSAISGTVFGAAGDGYVRFSYTNSMENIERALERMNRYLKEKGLTR